MVGHHTSQGTLQICHRCTYSTFPVQLSGTRHRQGAQTRRVAEHYSPPAHRKQRFSLSPKEGRHQQHPGSMSLARPLTRLPGIAQALGGRKVMKDHLRRLVVQEHEAERTLYKAMVSDATLPLDVRLQVQRLFESEMPRDAAANRVKNRCVLTGRARGVWRFARVSRLMIRPLAHYGLLPGVAKASW